MGRLRGGVVLAAFGASVVVSAAAIRVHVQYDREVDFTPLRSYAWHPDGAGRVMAMTSQHDDPEEIRRRLEPVIVSAIEQELVRRGFTPAPASTRPDLHVSYYLLISPAGASTDMLADFTLPGWGLPPIRRATNYLRVVERGSLVIDVSVTSDDAVAWRGVAEAEVDRQKTDQERAARLREAVAKMLEQFPPKPGRR